MNQDHISTGLEDVSSQELQHLIAVSTGFIDAYVIACHAREPMLLPQNIVLSARDNASHVQTVEWHEQQLPVFSVSDPARTLGVALIIEGEQASQRFALMCNEMPLSIRLRISEVVDDHRLIQDASILQYVRIAEKIYHVPDLSVIQHQLGL
ncbi:hypothetical protein [Acinetobacter sp. WZC-1]|uniref:hypothetical protein n=1 Tax=Acinetobacter sp. WZC-1 TaxID=3459034 RepID=UPI00403DED3E